MEPGSAVGPATKVGGGIWRWFKRPKPRLALRDDPSISRSSEWACLKLAVRLDLHNDGRAWLRESQVEIVGPPDSQGRIDFGAKGGGQRDSSNRWRVVLVGPGPVATKNHVPLPYFTVELRPE